MKEERWKQKKTGAKEGEILLLMFVIPMRNKPSFPILSTSINIYK